MPLTPAQIAALTAEIQTDPQTYGYAAFVQAGNDQGIANALNKVRTGDDGEAAITVARPDCTPAEVMNAIDIRDFTVPAQVNATLAGSYLESVLQFARIQLRNDDGTKTLMRRNLDRLVIDGTVQGNQGSQPRLDALAVRFGSRAEQLFGVGVHITNTQVANALGRF